MSGKIRSKDLSYDTTLPPFLQRLKNQHAGSGDTDRHERAIARPKKAHVSNDEDEPTVVDEHGETISKKELEERTVEASAKAETPISTNAETTGDSQPRRAAQKVTDGKAFLSNKRKAVKVIGEDDNNGKSEAEAEDPVDKPKIVKKAKKAKTIKLAFDDED